MSEDTALLVLYGVTAVGSVVWLIGLWFLVASRRVRTGSSTERFDSNAASSPNRIAGEVEVDGQPSELAVKAAAVLAQQGTWPVGRLKIIERTDDRVTFEGGGEVATGRGAGQWVRRGHLQFTRLNSGRTSIDYAVEVSSGRGMLLGGAIFQVLGLVALIVGFTLIRTLVVPNANPSIRGQTFQMFQVVHFLWPPFLFGGLYRKIFFAIRNGFDTLVHNLPYHTD